VGLESVGGTRDLEILERKEEGMLDLNVPSSNQNGSPKLPKLGTGNWPLPYEVEMALGIMKN